MHTPGVSKHLLPFLRRVDTQLPAADIKFSLRQILWCLGASLNHVHITAAILTVFAQEQLFAVGCQLIITDIFSKYFSFSVCLTKFNLL